MSADAGEAVDGAAAVAVVAGAGRADDHAPTGKIVVRRSRPPAEAERVAEALGMELVGMGSAGAKAMAVVRGEVEGSLPYRHMCNFMSTVWFKQLAAYEYAMRVDEDVPPPHARTNAT